MVLPVVDNRVTVVGDIELSGDEKAALLVNPDFGVFSQMDDELYEVEVLTAGIKHRWETGRDYEESLGVKEDKEEDRRIAKEMELIEARTRQVFNPETNDVNMGRLKVTDVKYNSRVVLPKPLEAAKEAMVAVRAVEWAKVRMEYKTEFVNKDDEQKSNLDAREKRGVKSLLKRVKEGEIVVIQSDKSGRLVVMSMEEYLRAGSVHTCHDVEVNQEFAKDNQRLLNGHTSCWLKIFNCGSDWSHETRHRETRLNKSCAIPVLRLLFKDHKNWKPTDGPPPTRPVCGANTGMNVHLSDLVSMVLEPLASSLPGSWEVISTDDYISRHEEYNTNCDETAKREGETANREGERMEVPEGETTAGHTAKCRNGPLSELVEDEERSTDSDLPMQGGGEAVPKSEDQGGCQETEGEPVIVGFDFVSLYPSLEAEMAAKEAHDAVMLSTLEFSGVNFKEGCKYIAANSSEASVAVNKLRRVLPWRPTKMGKRPGVTGPEALGPHSDGEALWQFPRGMELTDLDKKMVIAQVVAIGVRTMFQTHVYTFGGHLFHQKKGGPIGLRGTGAVARVVMAMCDIKVKDKMENSKVETQVDARYVDDVRNQLMPLKQGWRWSGERMERREEWHQEDEKLGTTGQRRTSRALLAVLNSIHPGILRCTTEIGEDFEDGRLPTLDTSVWIEEGRAKYTFYEKPTATSKVIDRRSALSENCKLASLSQNMIRRMRNTSERVETRERVEIVDNYTAKLINSGYTMDQARRVIVAGLKGYESQLEKAVRDGSKLHRSAKEGAAARYRKKLTAKSKWFKDKETDGDEVSEDGDPGEKYLFTPPKAKVSKGMEPWLDEDGGSAKEDEEKERSRVKQKLKKKRLDLPVTSVLFVEQTPGGIYAARLREREAVLAPLTGYRVKIVERSGSSMKSMLVRSDPFEGGKCSRENCLPCKAGAKNSKCSKRNILYESSCLECLSVGRDSDCTYVGESSRSAYERALEHVDAYKSKQADSHMWNHAANEHGGRQDLKWKFVVVRVFQRALSRQVSEAVRTRKRGEHLILNIKGVYNRCAVPELAVKHHDRIWQEERNKFPRERETVKVVLKVEETEEYEYSLMEEAGEDAKKRNREEQCGDEALPGRKKKKIWKGGYKDGEVWGEAGVGILDKTFLYSRERGETAKEEKKYKQMTIITMTEAEVIAADCAKEIVNLAVEGSVEASAWREQLEDGHGEEMVRTVEKEEERMMRGCQYDKMLERAGFEGEVFAREQSEKAARKEELGSEIEMLTVERMVRGQKRKIHIQTGKCGKRKERKKNNKEEEKVKTTVSESKLALLWAALRAKCEAEVPSKGEPDIEMMSQEISQSVDAEMPTQGSQDDGEEMPSQEYSQHDEEMISQDLDMFEDRETLMSQDGADSDMWSQGSMLSQEVCVEMPSQEPEEITPKLTTDVGVQTEVEVGCDKTLSCISCGRCKYADSLTDSAGEGGEEGWCTYCMECTVCKPVHQEIIILKGDEDGYKFRNGKRKMKINKKNKIRFEEPKFCARGESLENYENITIHTLPRLIIPTFFSQKKPEVASETLLLSESDEFPKFRGSHIFGNVPVLDKGEGGKSSPEVSQAIWGWRRGENI